MAPLALVHIGNINHITCLCPHGKEAILFKFLPLFKHTKKTISAYRMGMHFYNRLNFSEAALYFEQAIAGNMKSNSLETNLAKFYCERTYVSLGIAHFTRNENKQALENFPKALRLKPDDCDLNYFIGICQNNIGKYQEAMESFSKILASAPQDIPNKLKMSIIFHNLGMWKNAEEIQRNILKGHHYFADVHHHLGLSLMSQGKMSEAADSFTNALDVNPDYGDARLKLGMIQICLEQYDIALINLKILKKQNPEYADVYYLIALIKDKCGETEQGVTFLKKALRISPKFKNALVKLIIFYCRLGKIPEAEIAIRKAIAFYPNDRRFNALKNHFKLFQQALSAKEFENNFADEMSLKELRNEFHKHLDIMPNFSEIITMFSSSKYAKEDASIPNFLIPLIKEQIRQNPSFPDLYNSLGVQLLFCNKPGEAEIVFSKTVKLNPDYTEARINLFKTLYKNGKYTDAQDQGDILTAQNIQFPDVHYTFAQVLLELKRYDAALTHARLALTLCPAMDKSLILIARIHGCQGNFSPAIEAINNYLQGNTTPKESDTAKCLLTQFTNQLEKNDIPTSRKRP